MAYTMHIAHRAMWTVHEHRNPNGVTPYFNQPIFGTFDMRTALRMHTNILTYTRIGHAAATAVAPVNMDHELSSPGCSFGLFMNARVLEGKRNKSDHRCSRISFNIAAYHSFTFCRPHPHSIEKLPYYFLSSPIPHDHALCQPHKRSSLHQSMRIN